MALTREQFQQLRDKGLTVEQIVAFERGQKPEDLQRTQQLAKETSSNIFEEQKPTTFLGKTREFLTGVIGGGKLAQGLGQAIVAPEVTRTLSEESRQTEELQQKLLTAMRSGKEQGKATSRLEKALKNSQSLSATLQDAQKDFEESLVTKKEVVGSSLRLVGTLGTGLIGRTAAKGLALGSAKTFFGGALRGAGVGAISGGAIGGIHGAGIGLEENKELSGVATSALMGVGIGATTGAILGAATGGIGGVLKGRAIKREEFARNLVAPKETSKVKAEAIRQGRLQDPGFFKKAEIASSKRDGLLASSVDDVVKPEATLGENVDAIRLKINNTNTGVRSFILQNPKPFNANQLKTRLNSAKEELDLIFASDSAAENTYNKVVEAFMRSVEKKNTLGLFDARQSFDQLPAIKKLLNTQGLGENTKKEIVLSVRRAANEYIADLLPQGNQYKNTMRMESYMLEALGNISEKGVAIIGKNKLQIFTAQYPILKWVVGGAAAGAVGAAGIGGGSSIIGSSE